MELLKKRAQKINWLVFDVDGVLTDGRLYFNPDGDYMKAFFVKDGLGIEIARRAGFKVAILTARSSLSVQQRAKDLKFDLVIQGSKDKGDAIEKLINQEDISSEAIAYMGDDLIDLPAIKRVGLSGAPADAVLEVRNKVDWVSDCSGGAGAVRQWIEMILKCQNKWDEQVDFYLTK